MNSEEKTKQCDKYCEGCEEYTDKLDDWASAYDLCEECNDKYENQTGYCPLNCCLGGGCDQSC
jgi:hypothetical protein